MSDLFLFKEGLVFILDSIPHVVREVGMHVVSLPTQRIYSSVFQPSRDFGADQARSSDGFLVTVIPRVGENKFYSWVTLSLDSHLFHEQETTQVRMGSPMPKGDDTVAFIATMTINILVDNHCVALTRLRNRQLQTARSVRDELGTRREFPCEIEFCSFPHPEVLVALKPTDER